MKQVSLIIAFGIGFSIASGQINTSITTDKAEYYLGEPIEIFLTVHNQNQDTAKFEWPSCCEAEYYIDGFDYYWDCCQIPSGLILSPDSSHTWHWVHTADIYQPGEGVFFVTGEVLNYPQLTAYTTIAIGDLRLVHQTLAFDTTCTGPGCDTTYIDLLVSMDTVTLYWKTPELNMCLEPVWSGWLSADTFHMVMMDIGPPCDCVSCFVLTTSFAPFPIGTYTLDFWSNRYGYPTFIVDASVVTIQTDDLYITDFTLSQNYPNPFNPSTRIVYSLPRSDFVTLKVHDLRGRVLQTLVSEYQPEGEHTLYFDASPLPSGIYFYHLEAGCLKDAKKMVVVR